MSGGTLIRRLNPYNGGYAIPGNVRAETPSTGAIVSTWAKRGTQSQVSPRIRGGGYAVPRSVLTETPGRGVKVSAWRPRGTIDSQLPSDLAPAALGMAPGSMFTRGTLGNASGGIFSGGRYGSLGGAPQAAPGGGFGKQAADAVAKIIGRLPQAQQKEALKVSLNAVHKSLYPKVTGTMGRLGLKGALEAAFHDYSAQVFVHHGKGGKARAMGSAASEAYKATLAPNPNYGGSVVTDGSARGKATVSISYASDAAAAIPPKPWAGTQADFLRLWKGDPWAPGGVAAPRGSAPSLNPAGKPLNAYDQELYKATIGALTLRATTPTFTEKAAGMQNGSVPFQTAVIYGASPDAQNMGTIYGKYFGDGSGVVTIKIAKYPIRDVDPIAWLRNPFKTLAKSVPVIAATVAKPVLDAAAAVVGAVSNALCAVAPLAATGASLYTTAQTGGSVNAALVQQGAANVTNTLCGGGNVLPNANENLDDTPWGTYALIGGGLAVVLLLTSRKGGRR